MSKTPTMLLVFTFCEVGGGHMAPQAVLIVETSQWGTYRDLSNSPVPSRGIIWDSVVERLLTNDAIARKRSKRAKRFVFIETSSVRALRRLICPLAGSVLMCRRRRFRSRRLRSDSQTPPAPLRWVVFSSNYTLRLVLRMRWLSSCYWSAAEAIQLEMMSVGIIDFSLRRYLFLCALNKK